MDNNKLTIQLDMAQAYALATIFSTIVHHPDEFPVEICRAAREVWDQMVDAAVLEGKINITDLPPREE